MRQKKGRIIMTNNKNKLRAVIVIAIAVVVFNVLAFVIPFAKGGVFWISYGFGMLAILAQFFVIWLAFSKAETVKSKLYGLPILRIGVIYAVLQIILSIVFMATGIFIPVWVPIIPYILILAFAAFGLIATDTVRDTIEAQDAKLNNRVSYMRGLTEQANGLASAPVEDSALKAALQELYEEIRYSDPTSSEATQSAERRRHRLRSQILHLHQGARKAAQPHLQALQNLPNVTPGAGTEPALSGCF